MPKMKKIVLSKWRLLQTCFPHSLKLNIFSGCLKMRQLNYGMISCPSGKIAESKGRIGSIILLGHEKELLYMLI